LLPCCGGTATAAPGAGAAGGGIECGGVIRGTVTSGGINSGSTFSAFACLAGQNQNAKRAIAAITDRASLCPDWLIDWDGMDALHWLLCHDT
jgi:hypothetical protein